MGRGELADTPGHGMGLARRRTVQAETAGRQQHCPAQANSQPRRGLHGPQRKPRLDGQCNGRPHPHTLAAAGAAPARGAGAAVGVRQAEAQPPAALGSLARLLAVAAELAFPAGWKNKCGLPSPAVCPCAACCLRMAWHWP